MSAKQLRIVCMRCTAVIKDGDSQLPTSHGVCDACAVQMRAENEALLRQLRSEEAA